MTNITSNQLPQWDRLLAAAKDLCTAVVRRRETQGVPLKYTVPWKHVVDLETAIAAVDVASAHETKSNAVERRLAEACERMRRAAAIVAMSGDQSMAMAIYDHSRRLLGDIKPWWDSENAQKASAQVDLSGLDHPRQRDVMDIRSEPGTKVQYMDCNGYPGDVRHCRQAGLVKDQIYEVVELDVYECSSTVRLKGLDGWRFNTVCFCNAENGSSNANNNGEQK